METTRTNFALFPLPVILFPGETVQLHIFEPRYQQLIRHCEQLGMQFGIPFTSLKSDNLGAVVQLEEIKKRYPNGESDIIVKATDLFHVVHLEQQLTNVLYPGGTINLETNYKTYTPSTELKDYFQKFLDFKGESVVDYILDNEFTVYHIAGYLYMNTDEKLEFLKRKTLAQKDKFLINYLKILTIELTQEEAVYNGFYLN